MSDKNPLEQELKAFDDMREELLGRARGQFALLHDDELAGVFASVDDALKAGFDKFGNAPFLVKAILDVDVPQNFTSFQIG